MIFMMAFLSKVSIFIPRQNKWASFLLFFISIFATAIVEATPSFQKFKNDSDSSVHFKLKAIVDPASVKPRGRFALYVNLELSAGWHIYSLYAKGDKGQSLATAITLDSDMFISSGFWEEPIPTIVWDGALERVVKTHKQAVEFRRWYHAVESLDSGFYKIKGSIVFRACNNKVCNLPRRLFYEARIKVSNGEN